MDNKNELFDLAREKRELDDFLSTIAGDEVIADLRAPGDDRLKAGSPADESQFELQAPAAAQTDWRIDVKPEVISENEAGGISIDKDFPKSPFE